MRGPRIEKDGNAKMYLKSLASAFSPDQSTLLTQFRPLDQSARIGRAKPGAAGVNLIWIKVDRPETKERVPSGR